MELVLTNAQLDIATIPAITVLNVPKIVNLVILLASVPLAVMVSSLMLTRSAKLVPPDVPLVVAMENVQHVPLISNKRKTEPVLKTPGGENGGPGY